MAEPGPGPQTLVRENLSLRQHRAIELVQTATAISASEYARVLNVAKPTATRDLADLVHKRYLTRSGRARATVYMLRSEP